MSNVAALTQRYEKHDKRTAFTRTQSSAIQKRPFLEVPVSSRSRKWSKIEKWQIPQAVLGAIQWSADRPGCLQNSRARMQEMQFTPDRKHNSFVAVWKALLFESMGEVEGHLVYLLSCCFCLAVAPVCDAVRFFVSLRV